MADKRLQMPQSCAQVLIKYLLDGQPCENVLYVEHRHQSVIDVTVAADFDGGAADVVGARIKTWLTDHWQGFAHGLAEATEVDVIWNTVTGAGPLAGRVYQDSDYPIVGSNIGEPLPNNCTIAVELRTDLLGRSFHGRQYVVGLNDGHIDADAPNKLKAASLTDVPGIWESLRTDLANWTGIIAPRDAFPLQVMSFVHNGVARTPATIEEVKSCTISDPFLDSMRRRLPGHNRHGRRH